MANILEILQRELDVAAAEGAQPVSWELSTEALSTLKTVDDETIAPSGGETAFGLPITKSNVPGFAILLNTKPK